MHGSKDWDHASVREHLNSTLRALWDEDYNENLKYRDLAEEATSWEDYAAISYRGLYGGLMECALVSATFKCEVILLHGTKPVGRNGAVLCQSTWTSPRKGTEHSQRKMILRHMDLEGRPGVQHYNIYLESWLLDSNTKYTSL